MKAIIHLHSDRWSQGGRPVWLPLLAWALWLGIVTDCLADAEKPNVVLILSDNQSYYEMGCHGHAVVRTPHIDQLAGESVDFQKLYAPPFCSPSRAVILTGRYAMRSGVHNTIGGRSILHSNETTLADILSENGYATGIFGKWHLGFSYPYRPEDRGFWEVFVHGGGGIGQMEDYFGNTHYSPTFIHNGEVKPCQGFSTDVIFDHAIDFVLEQKGKGKPFFAFISTPVTHSPHRGPKDLVAELKASGVEGDVELFGQIENLDSNIGRVMTLLEDEGLAGETLLIYASDQGMSDRGAPHGSHRQSLGHDPAHHVPFMVRLPGAEPQISSRLAGMIDLFPTVLDYCGLPAPNPIDGFSLLPLIRQEAGYPDVRTLIIQCPRGRTAEKWKNASVKTDRWRLVGKDLLYDAAVDPRQLTDVSAEHPEVVEELRAAYEAYWADLPDQAVTLPRHILGAEGCPEVTLCGMDWYVGAAPWNSGHLRGRKKQNGAWAVTVERAGSYRFDCHHYPREANLPAGASRARIQLGEVSEVVEIDGNEPFVRFTLNLEPGDFDLQTWLRRGDVESGALFVYVTYLGEAR